MHRHGIGSSGLSFLRRVGREVLPAVGLFVMSEGAPIVRCVKYKSSGVRSLLVLARQGRGLPFHVLPLLRSLHSSTRRVDVPMIRE
jgi:hypothetical protein